MADGYLLPPGAGRHTGTISTTVRLLRTGRDAMNPGSSAF
jgi:hypothetical protein